ncbi:hypothetical protein, partial [Leptospira interrogans]|uniref:hypothetical protein n=1 Tax=Leptospira interrogans TaxID=173 RepID=UPI0005B3A9E3
GIKDIIKNLLDLSPQEENTFKDLITQYSTLRKNLKKIKSAITNRLRHPWRRRLKFGARHCR